MPYSHGITNTFQCPQSLHFQQFAIYAKQFGKHSPKNSALRVSGFKHKLGSENVTSLVNSFHYILKVTDIILPIIVISPNLKRKKKISIPFFIVEYPGSVEYEKLIFYNFPHIFFNPQSLSRSKQQSVFASSCEIFENNYAVVYAKLNIGFILIFKKCAIFLIKPRLPQNYTHRYMHLTQIFRQHTQVCTICVINYAYIKLI